MRRNPSERGVANFIGFSPQTIEELMVLLHEYTSDLTPKASFRIQAQERLVSVDLFPVNEGDYRWIWIAKDKGELVGVGGFTELPSEMLALVTRSYRKKGLYSKILLELASYFRRIWSDTDMSEGAVGAWEKAGATFVPVMQRYTIKIK